MIGMTVHSAAPAWSTALRIAASVPPPLRHQRSTARPIAWRCRVRRLSNKPSARPNVVATHARNRSQSNDGYGWEL
ncbi:hypothetical protein MCEMAEM6B_02442 [Mycobacteriaceae bacterium]